jgi:hypothetical protein
MASGSEMYNAAPIYDLATEFRHFEKVSELSVINEQLRAEVKRLKAENKELREILEDGHKRYRTVCTRD